MSTKNNKGGRSFLKNQEAKSKLLTVINDESKSYKQVLDFINYEMQEAVRLVNFNYKLVGFRSDAAFALNKAIEKIVGYTKQSKDETPSGGENPPTMIDIKLSNGERIKVPFGKMDLPNFGEEAYVDMQYNAGNQTLVVQGQCQKMYVHELDDIINLATEILRTDSIYKGQAMKYVKGREPEFINLNGIDKQNLFLTEEAKFTTEPIEARITKTAECIANNIDIKYGVLLEGPYGTGKTLYAFKLAKKAVDNGWSFMYCKNAEDTLEAMQVAQRYTNNGKGVVLFIEDIDKILSKRDQYTNEISLLMDGGESKDLNLITIFTTNHMSDIDPTFLRGKRIGAVVSLTAPDANTAEQMLQAMLVNENGDSFVTGDLTESASKIEELQIVPAFIAEIADRVKAHLIFSGKKEVTDKDVLNAIAAYQRQMDAAKPKDHTITPEMAFYKAYQDMIESKAASGETLEAVRNTVETTLEKVDYIYDNA